jgi:3',5'-cyclic AMP phosphodiesterase CpdA
MCDPQLGFGGYEHDIRTFRQATQQINALHPDFVVICGDLVNGSSRKSYSDFKALLHDLNPRCFCAPGNHDVHNAPTPASLAFYRKEMGPDYYSFEQDDSTFIVLDTQLWKSPVPGETERQEGWFRNTLSKAHRAGRRIFLIQHVPFFVKSADEPDNYYNLPEEKRLELLRLCEENGVVAILAGHTHKTIINDYHGILMVTGELTSRNFDHRPLGFRVWHIGAQRPFQSEVVPLNVQ